MALGQMNSVTTVAVPDHL